MRQLPATKTDQQDTSPPTEEQSSETPAEMTERVHQVVSAFAEGILALARKRFGPNLELLDKEQEKNSTEPIDVAQPPQ